MIIYLFFNNNVRTIKALMNWHGRSTKNKTNY